MSHHEPMHSIMHVMPCSPRPILVPCSSSSSMSSFTAHTPRFSGPC